MQQWWNGFVDWYLSDAGWRIISSAVIPFLAIVVAGIVAASIGRGSTRRVLSLNDRERRASAVTAMIGSARRAAVWNTLSAPEQRQADYAALESDIRLRLLSVPGASMASDWAAHEIAQMKKNAVSFSFQAEQSLLEFRNRLVDWHSRPSRAKKLFKNDLDRWAYDTSLADQDLVAQQQAWAAQQAAEQDERHAAPQTNTDPQPVSRREATTRREAATSGAVASGGAPSGAAASSVPAPAAQVPLGAVSATATQTPAAQPLSAQAPAVQTPAVQATAAAPIPASSATSPIEPPLVVADPVTANPYKAAPEPESGASDVTAATTGESHVVEDPLVPSPVPVSKVRERINPSATQHDELH